MKKPRGKIFVGIAPVKGRGKRGTDVVSAKSFMIDCRKAGLTEFHVERPGGLGARR